VGAVDRLVPVLGLAGRVPVREPAVAVNLHGRGPQSHRLLHDTRPGRLLAFANLAAGHTDGPQWRDEEHEVLRWCRLTGWYGISSDPADLGLAVPADRGLPRGVTIVHPGAKAAARRWPVRRFAALARALTGTGHRVVVTGSTEEADLVTRVVRDAGLPRAAAFAGHTNMADLAWLVAHARLLVSGDTGVAHLATAYGTPSVVLFGPVAPRRWGPPPDRAQHHVIWHGPTLTQITVAEVLSGAARVQGLGRGDV
jgi:hypothetical protein